MINFGELVHKLITFVIKEVNNTSNFGMQLCVSLADLSENLYVDNTIFRCRNPKDSLKRMKLKVLLKKKQNPKKKNGPQHAAIHT